MGKETRHNKGVYLTLCLRQLGISQIQSHYSLEHSNGRCPGCDYHIGVGSDVVCSMNMIVLFLIEVLELWRDFYVLSMDSDW